MAPEVITSSTYSVKADTYSYGIVLWEIMSRQPPYKNTNGPTVIYRVVNLNERPDISLVPADCPIQLMEIMKACWERDPTKRPLLGLVAKSLQKLLNMC